MKEDGREEAVPGPVCVRRAGQVQGHLVEAEACEDAGSVLDYPNGLPRICDKGQGEIEGRGRSEATENNPREYKLYMMVMGGLEILLILTNLFKQLREEQRKKLEGAKVDIVYRRGKVVSGVHLFLSVKRCGLSFKFIGRSEEHMDTFLGFVYKEQVLVVLAAHNKWCKEEKQKVKDREKKMQEDMYQVRTKCLVFV